MNTTTLALFVMGCFLTMPVYAQSLDTIYLDKDLHTVKTTVEAKYFRLQVQGKKMLHSKVRFYYLDGLLSHEHQYDKGVKEGRAEELYPNGTTRCLGNYHRDQPVGKWEWWYADGKPLQVIYYPEEVPPLITEMPTFQVESFWDSTGHQMITNGTGKYQFYYANGQLEHQGEFLNGNKHKEWIGYYESGKPYYEEEWEEGELVAGKSYSEAGKEFTYTQSSEMPSYNGGMQGLYKYLSSTMRYPKQARRNRISGEVKVSFIVGKDGRIRDADVIQSVGGGCDEEALRVVQGMAVWNPGIQRGQPVDVHYLLPIRFTLQ